MHGSVLTCKCSLDIADSLYAIQDDRKFLCTFCQRYVHIPTGCLTLLCNCFHYIPRGCLTLLCIYFYYTQNVHCDVYFQHPRLFPPGSITCLLLPLPSLPRARATRTVTVNSGTAPPVPSSTIPLSTSVNAVRCPG